MKDKFSKIIILIFILAICSCQTHSQQTTTLNVSGTTKGIVYYLGKIDGVSSAYLSYNPRKYSRDNDTGWTIQIDIYPGLCKENRIVVVNENLEDGFKTVFKEYYRIKNCQECLDKFKENNG